MHHPTDPTLTAYGLGKLEEAVAETVYQHLETCDECRNRVAGTPSDSFVTKLQVVREDAALPLPARAHADRDAPRIDSHSANTVSLPGGASPIDLPLELASYPDYDILRELGHGGMGVVYLARNKLMDRLEVLKVLNKGLLNKPGMPERFLREIRSAARLSHANVVAALSASQWNGSLVFAMEFIDGHDLSQLVRVGGPLSVSTGKRPFSLRAGICRPHKGTSVISPTR